MISITRLLMTIFNISDMSGRSTVTTLLSHTIEQSVMKEKNKYKNKNRHKHIMDSCLAIFPSFIKTHFLASCSVTYDYKKWHIIKMFIVDANGSV